MPFKRTRIQKSHHVALPGKSNVKHRRGWSRRNLSSSQMPLFFGTRQLKAQITKRNMQGKPVLPTTIKNDPTSNGKTAA